MQPFEWLDTHSGSVIALASIALALITAGYVIFTQRLVGAQHLGTKREIVERVYKPIIDHLDEIIWGSSPRLQLWDKIKDSQPFLVFHHLIPSGIRNGLNEMSDTWAASGREVCDQLWQAIHDTSAKIAGVEYSQSAGWARFEFSIGHEGYFTFLYQLILTNKGIDEASRRAELDSAEGHVLLGPRISGESEEGRNLDVPEAMQLLYGISNALDADDALVKLLAQHRAYLDKAEGIHDMIKREIEKGSRI